MHVQTGISVHGCDKIVAVVRDLKENGASLCLQINGSIVNCVTFYMPIDRAMLLADAINQVESSTERAIAAGWAKPVSGSEVEYVPTTRATPESQSYADGHRLRQYEVI